MAEPLRTLEIESSPAKLLFLVGICVVMTAASIALVVLPAEMLPDMVLSYAKAKIVGALGAVFFGLCTVVVVWRLFTSQGPVITISPEGIRDTRIASEVIPWSAVTAISTWQFKGQKAMVLGMKPGIEARLGLTRTARWTRSANRSLGADGLCVTASGVKIDYDTLLRTCVAYANAKQP
jgi:hypothetical protein